MTRVSTGDAWDQDQGHGHHSFSSSSSPPQPSSIRIRIETSVGVGDYKKLKPATRNIVRHHSSELFIMSLSWSSLKQITTTVVVLSKVSIGTKSDIKPKIKNNY